MIARERKMVGAGILVVVFAGIIPSFILQHASEGNLNHDLIQAAELGDANEVKALLAQGADANARDIPPTESPGLMQRLIHIFRGPTRPSYFERTALLCAVGSVHPDGVTKVLLDNGADPNPKYNGRGSPLSWAVCGDQLSVIEMLVNKGADVNASGSGETPLQAAKQYDHPDLVIWLKAHGAK